MSNQEMVMQIVCLCSQFRAHSAILFNFFLLCLVLFGLDDWMWSLNVLQIVWENPRWMPLRIGRRSLAPRVCRKSTTVCLKSCRNNRIVHTNFPHPHAHRRYSIKIKIDRFQHNHPLFSPCSRFVVSTFICCTHTHFLTQWASTHSLCQNVCVKSQSNIV